MLSPSWLHYRNPTATILPTAEVVRYKPSPVVASFSSRGPSSLTENILKVFFFPMFSHALFILSLKLNHINKHLEKSALTVSFTLLANFLSSLMSWLQELAFWLL